MDLPSCCESWAGVISLVASTSLMICPLWPLLFGVSRPLAETNDRNNKAPTALMMLANMLHTVFWYRTAGPQKSVDAARCSPAGMENRAAAPRLTYITAEGADAFPGPASNGSVCSTRRPRSVPLPCPSWHSCHPSIPCLDQWGCTGVANGGGSELCYAQIIVCGLNRWWVVRLMSLFFLLQQVNRIKCNGRHFVQNINYTRSLNIEVWSYKVTLFSPLPNRSPWPTSPFV